MDDSDLYELANAQLREAGRTLARFFREQCPDERLDERLGALDPGQSYVLELAGGRSFQAVLNRRMLEHHRRAEAERKANRTLIRYPSISRKSFDAVGAEPAPIGGVVEPSAS